MLDFHNNHLFEIFKQPTHSSLRKVDQYTLEEKKISKFSDILAKEPMVYQEIKNLSWDGIPQCIRAKIWKYLLKYISGNKSKCNEILVRKRQQYHSLVQKYLPIYDLETIENEGDKKIAKIIEGDVKRTLPEAKIIRDSRIKILLTRCLYIWHIRHPASGYVQGMNDLIIPFFLTFLQEYHPIEVDNLSKEINIGCITDQTLQFMEADIYWCISKMLEIVTSNYISGFSGMHESFRKVENLLKKIDPKLYRHLIKHNVDLFCLAFKQISTFLLRLFTPRMGIRLFDTLISYQDQYPIFLQYVFVAILVKFSKTLTNLHFDEIMKFLQHMPTKSWSQAELQMLISEAYVYKELYHKQLA